MAAKTRIPPPPVSSDDKTVWNNWYISVKDAINSIRAELKWVNLVFTGSKITDIVDRNHNDLLSINGGTTTERYHLTAAQWTDLTDGGTSILHIHVLTVTATLDFASIASLATAELAVTVTGAVVGKPVRAGPPAAIAAGLMWGAYVSAADTVRIRLYNSTAAAIDPVSAAWTVSVNL